MTAETRYGARRGYRALWRWTPGTVVYVFAGYVLAMVGFSVLIAALAAGVGLLVVVVGVAVLVATLWIARGFALASTGLLRLTGLPPIPEPEWDRSRRGPLDSGLRRFLAPLRSARYWSALVHQLVVQPLLATVSFLVLTAWLSVGVGGLTYFLWRNPLIRLDDANRGGDELFSGPVQLFGGIPTGLDPAYIPAVEYAITLVVGLVLLLTLPWVAAGCAHLHYWPARVMLGRWASDDLAVRLRDENLAREAAIRAEDRSLHRLERDLHDGPQQRLVRLQMDLAALERRIAAADADGATALAAEARAQAQFALDELRALSSGVAPPLLTDRGPAAALQSLAAGCGVPVTADIAPDLDEYLGPETGRALYFVVAELLTNVVKHSGAGSARLSVGRPGEGGLVLEVCDDGRGGARFVDGHGLAGLADRVRGLHGELTVESPAGGPTRVRVELAPPTLNP